MLQYRDAGMEWTKDSTLNIYWSAVAQLAVGHHLGLFHKMGISTCRFSRIHYIMLMGNYCLGGQK